MNLDIVTVLRSHVKPVTIEEVDGFHTFALDAIMRELFHVQGDSEKQRLLQLYVAVKDAYAEADNYSGNMFPRSYIENVQGELRNFIRMTEANVNPHGFCEWITACTSAVEWRFDYFPEYMNGFHSSVADATYNVCKDCLVSVQENFADERGICNVTPVN